MFWKSKQRGVIYLMRSNWKPMVLIPSVLVTVLILVAITGGLIFQPQPSGRLVIATGGASGLNQQLAESYRHELERNGVTLELRPAIDGFNTLKALVVDKNVDAGFVKGGFVGGLQGRYATAADRAWHEKDIVGLRSVGRLFYEPLWVFYRGPEVYNSLRELKGKRILIGNKQSGARRVVAHLLKASGVDATNASLREEELSEDGAALLSEQADVAFLILPPEAEKVQKLLHNPKLHLMSFATEAEAYVNRFPYLSKIVLHQGAVEFAPDIPATSVTLLATSTALVVRTDLHPALVGLLTHAVIQNPKPGFDHSGEPILFYSNGQFPTEHDPEFEMARDAQAIYKSGELPFLLRALAPVNAKYGLPFWLTAFASEHGTQTILLLIPLLSVLFPLIRVAPMLYSWSVRRRLLRWYRQLKSLETSSFEHWTTEQLAGRQSELERIDAAVARIRVPLNFSNQLYDLRGHIDLVRQRLKFESSAMRTVTT
jgi:uncharacterized protein